MGYFLCKELSQLPPSQIFHPKLRSPEVVPGWMLRGWLCMVSTARVDFTYWPVSQGVQLLPWSLQRCHTPRKLFRPGLPQKRKQLTTMEGGACPRPLAGEAPGGWSPGGEYTQEPGLVCGKVAQAVSRGG